MRDHEQFLLSHQKLLSSFDTPGTVEARLSCLIGLLQECRNGVGGRRRSHPRRRVLGDERFESLLRLRASKTDEKLDEFGVYDADKPNST